MKVSRKVEGFVVSSPEDKEGNFLRVFIEGILSYSAGLSESSSAKLESRGLMSSNSFSSESSGWVEVVSGGGLNLLFHQF